MILLCILLNICIRLKIKTKPSKLQSQTNPILNLYLFIYKYKLLLRLDNCQSCGMAKTLILIFFNLLSFLRPLHSKDPSLGREYSLSRQAGLIFCLNTHIALSLSLTYLCRNNRFLPFLADSPLLLFCYSLCNIIIQFRESFYFI